MPPAKPGRTARNVLAYGYLLAVVAVVVGVTWVNLERQHRFQTWTPDKNTTLHYVEGRFLDDLSAPTDLPLTMKTTQGRTMTFRCYASRGGDGRRRANNCLAERASATSGKVLRVKYYTNRYPGGGFENVILETELDGRLMFYQSFENSYAIR
ncbi:MAG: hypothetical protein QM608_10455 [Caulobacter sp.]